jgi:hypothetical protein
MIVDRHLQRVAARLPATAAELHPTTDASDAVILHLWQATQIVIDLAMSACFAMKLGTPSSYADAFQRLHGARVIGAESTDRLVRAAGSARLPCLPARSRSGRISRVRLTMPVQLLLEKVHDPLERVESEF